MRAFKIAASPEGSRLVMGLRAIAVLGLAAIPLNYLVLSRLVAIVETVRAGDPFVAANADRLQRIAWALLALQLLSLAIGGIAAVVSIPAHPLHLDAGISINGWLAVLLTFLLARVFAEERSCAKSSKGRSELAIAVKLDDLLHDRRMTLTELADRVGMTLANLSILKTGKARAIRFSTLDAICNVLSCQPGDLLRFEPARDDEHALQKRQHAG